VIVLMTLIFYVFSVMATTLYGARFPDWFGSIGLSAYSLFQIMTLESWSMGIVRPVMEVYPNAWAFFIPFILCTAFTVLNLFIGIIVGAMQEDIEAEAAADRQSLHEEQATIAEELRGLRADVDTIRRLLSDLAERSKVTAEADRGPRARG
jgi:voltage-gated sodium channel